MPTEETRESHEDKKLVKAKKFIHDKYNYIVSGFSLIALFYAFSFFFAKGGKLDRFNFDMTVKIQNTVPIRFDPYLSLLSIVGSFEVTSIILAISLFARKKIGGIIVFGMFCLMHVIEIGGKAFIDHPGTPFMFHRYAFDFTFPSSYVQPGGSYPSGHAMRAIFLVIVIGYIVSRTKLAKYQKYIAYSTLAVFYVIMAISRVSLGEHWTSDIIGGTLLGAGFAILSIIFI